MHGWKSQHSDKHKRRYENDNCPYTLCGAPLGCEASANDSTAGLHSHADEEAGRRRGSARKHSIKLPLLADVGLEASRRYGITLGGAGLRRPVFVIDRDGVVRWKHVTMVGLTFPSTQTITAQLTGLR